MRLWKKTFTPLVMLTLGLCLGSVANLFATQAVAEPTTRARNTDLERFLPNHGNSVYNASGLLRQWPAGGPKELWRVDIGWGKSAVVEADGLAFTATQTDKKQWALCLDPLTGSTRWKHLLHAKENRHVARGPVTSPVVDGDRVYFIPYVIDKDVWDMHCPVICLKMTSGEELWRLEKGVWATEASTPLVVGNVLYVAADSTDRAILTALDKRTGAVHWTTRVPSDSKRELAAPSSLTYQIVEGIPQIVVATYGTREILGIDARNGSIMWRYGYPAKFSVGLVSTPVAVEQYLFLCAGEGKNKNFSTCFEMKAVNNTLTYRQVYYSTELQTNNYNTVAIYRDAIFGFGGQGSNGFIHCTDLHDGRLLWKQVAESWSKDQQLIIADDLMFAISKQEELVLAKPSRAGYQELARFPLNLDLGRPQQPTLANGRMYIRGKQSIACYQLVP